LFVYTQGDNWIWSETTAGVPWNFTAGCNPCAEQWQGVTCNTSETRDSNYVYMLAVSQYNLQGPLPGSLGNLTGLTSLDVSKNAITGTIPSELGTLTSLKQLQLNNNHFTGTIPSSLGNISQLAVLLFEYNDLRGTMPNSLGDLAALQLFSTTQNYLTGTLPASLGALTQLKAFNVELNLLSGTIPASYGTWTQLEVFSVNDNNLEGTLPEFLCTFADLKVVTTYNNPSMHGPLLPCLGTLSKITYLLLYHNSFTGTIPASYTQAPTLQLLSLHRNRLTGTIPSDWAADTQLAEFWLYENRLTGSIPASVGSLASLILIDFHNNTLTGSIPAELGAQLSQLQYLDLKMNALTGSIPHSFGGLSALTTLTLTQNHLSGTVPTELSQMGKLTTLFLENNHLSGSLDGVFNVTQQAALLIVQVSDNRLSGTLPASAFLLPSLNTFVAVSNCFSGTLPEAICGNQQLVSLILDGLQTSPHCRERLLPGVSDAYIGANHFGGTIPPCFFSLSKLRALHLAGNSLSGTLPELPAASVQLVDLSLSHNALTGTIPASLQLRPWDNLDLSFNRLTGELQVGFGEYINGTGVSYALQDNRLSGRAPSALVGFTNVSMLGSNMFSCEVDKRDLPKHDSQRNNYLCGSDSFNYPFYVWLAVTAAVCAALAVCGYCPRWVGRWGWVKNAIECHRTWMAQSISHGGNLKYVLGVAELLCWLSVVGTVLIVTVLLPWYSAAGRYFGTYTHKYAWSVSAAFLSGLTPALVQLLLYLLLLGVLAGGLTYGIARCGKADDSTAALIEDDYASLSWRLFVYGSVLSINSVLVGGVNLVFVLVALYGTAAQLVIAQVLLSVFKLVWNSVAVSALIRVLSVYVSSAARTTGFVTIHIVAALFNNIAIPCLVVAVVSPSCFYNVFDAVPPVDSQFAYTRCVATSTDNSCEGYETVLLTSSYSPPFTYSYQCSSSFVTYYAPAFVYLGLAAAFGMPLLKAVAQQLHKHASSGSWLHTALDAVLPPILKPVPSLPSEPGSGGRQQFGISGTDVGIAEPARAHSDTVVGDKLRPFFDANMYIISLITYLGIMLTFGVVFPPVAVAMCVTMLSVAWQGKLAVGRFLHNAREVNARQYESVVEQECRGAGSESKLRLAGLLILWACCWFYALFLFDTLGNDVGERGALWVAVLLLVLPVCLAAVLVIRGRVRGSYQQAEAHTTNRRTPTAAGVELTSASAQPNEDTVVDSIVDDTLSALHATVREV
jgi:Leucine-rich repeat (LRR) protein